MENELIKEDEIDLLQLFHMGRSKVDFVGNNSIFNFRDISRLVFG